MNTTNVFRRTLNLALASLLGPLVGLSAFGAESSARPTSPGSVETVNVIQTSFVPRVITNVIEMRVPTNIFVNLYRTNLVTRYQTNLNLLTQTNFVTRYQTNVNTLTLTNWEAVLVFRTNWIKRPITNLVQIDMPAERADATRAARAIESKGNTATTAASAASTDGPILEAMRTAKPSVNGQAEICLRLKSAGDETPKFSSQEWKVERTDNSVLLFGRGPEFKREVPLGAYKVEMKARSAEIGPPVRVRGDFEVTRDQVIQSKPPGFVNAR